MAISPRIITYASVQQELTRLREVPQLRQLDSPLAPFQHSKFARIPILCSIFMDVEFYFPRWFTQPLSCCGPGSGKGAVGVSTFTHMCNHMWVSFAETAADGGKIENFVFVLAFFLLWSAGNPSEDA